MMNALLKKLEEIAKKNKVEKVENLYRVSIVELFDNSEMPAEFLEEQIYKLSKSEVSAAYYRVIQRSQGRFTKSNFKLFTELFKRTQKLNPTDINSALHSFAESKEIPKSYKIEIYNLAKTFPGFNGHAAALQPDTIEEVWPTVKENIVNSKATTFDGLENEIPYLTYFQFIQSKVNTQKSKELLNELIGLIASKLHAPADRIGFLERLYSSGLSDHPIAAEIFTVKEFTPLKRGELLMDSFLYSTPKEYIGELEKILQKANSHGEQVELKLVEKIKEFGQDFSKSDLAAFGEAYKWKPETEKLLVNSLLKSLSTQKLTREQRYQLLNSLDVMNVSDASIAQIKNSAGFKERPYLNAQVIEKYFAE